MLCPYYQESNKYCNICGTYQDGYHKENYCLSSSNWRNCANYSNSSRDQKISKKLRSNPDL